MLTVRLTTGLTQAALADLLGISRHTVGGWESGQSYPKANHLKQFIALAVQRHVFQSGNETEEIHALWQAAHQKVLLNEPWLQGLLIQQASLFLPVSVEQTHDHDAIRNTSTGDETRVDWGDALDVPTFYGREEELLHLSRKVVEERCRVVSVLGIGGIGKSALTVTLMHQVARQFEVVIWRSLRDAPGCSTLLDTCLQVLAPHLLQEMPDTLEGRLHLLMEQFRARRVLLVLDNLEMLLEEGEVTGRMRAGYEGYAQLLRRIGETAHQSCLLLASREKPAELVSLEGPRSPVQALRLTGLDGRAGAQLLAEKDVIGSPRDWERLVEVYWGNPLALKIVAQTIVELFGGEIFLFLEQGEVVFGGVRKLLDEQFGRLSALEQIVFYWLAILREPVSLEELLAVLRTPKTPMNVLETLDSLRRRSLIEIGQRTGSFTLQSVVLEYATVQLITEVDREIEQGRLVHLIEHGLCQAKAKEYVRQAQEQLLLEPIVTQLYSTYQGQADLEERLLWLLDGLRGRNQKSQGYGPANLVMLLRVLRGDLRGLDLSRLALRGVSLQGVEMQDARLSESVLRDSVFTDPIDAITAVAMSKNGQYWAAVNWRGEVRVWAEGGQTLQLVWQAHVASVPALTFSPDGHTLASVSWDNTIKLWDVKSGTLLWVGRQTGSINGVAFAPDGRLLASGGGNTFIQIWDTDSGTNLRRLAGQSSAVYSVAWRQDGKRLAGGCSDGSIWMWRLEAAESDSHLWQLSGHTHPVTGLAFSPDGIRLASASFDGMVKLWDVESGHCLQTLVGHTDRAFRVAWSPDGHTLASGSFDHTIRLWDGEKGSLRMVLQGHTAIVYDLTFSSNSRTLLSGSADGTVQVWDVESGQRLRIIGGYVGSLFDLDWSPDGQRLASGGADTLVKLWDRTRAASPSVLRGHRWNVQGLAWSPDGRLLASAAYDGMRLWDTATGMCLQMLLDPDSADTVFQGLTWSPDGRWLACGSFLRGVHVWDMITRTRQWVGETQPTRIRRVAWSPDGTRLAGGCDDGIVYVWDTVGTQRQRLVGHDGTVMSVAWSLDGMRLASAGSGKGNGEIFVWEVHSGERVLAIVEHPGAASAVAWSSSGKQLISGGDDGMLRWWDIRSGYCVRVQEGHQGMVQAIKMNPDGTRLASCGSDGAIILWDMYSGEQFQTLRQDRPYERLNITGIKGLTAAQKVSMQSLGALEDISVSAFISLAPQDKQVGRYMPGIL